MSEHPDHQTATIAAMIRCVNLSPQIEERSKMQIGMMFNTDAIPGTELAAFARDLEASDLDMLWVPELFGREPFVTGGAQWRSIEPIAP
jgi:hypothetical protein